MKNHFLSLNLLACTKHRTTFSPKYSASWREFSLKFIHLQTKICQNSATHDSHIFRNSSLKDRLKCHPGLQDGMVFGDSGYACKPYLLTLYLLPTTRAKESYNEAHKRTRTQIKRAFGWLKRRFGVSMKKSG